MTAPLTEKELAKALTCPHGRVRSVIGRTGCSECGDSFAGGLAYDGVEKEMSILFKALVAAGARLADEQARAHRGVVVAEAAGAMMGGYIARLDSYEEIIVEGISIGDALLKEDDGRAVAHLEAWLKKARAALPPEEE